MPTLARVSGSGSALLSTDDYKMCAGPCMYHCTATFLRRWMSLSVLMYVAARVATDAWCPFVSSLTPEQKALRCRMQLRCVVVACLCIWMGHFLALRK